ncbi:unnamed protein product, partial [Adineta steineri]
LSFNRQSIFDSLFNTLVRSGDVEEVQPDINTGQFILIDPTAIAVPILSSTITSIIPINNNNYTFEFFTNNITNTTVEVPSVGNIYHPNPITPINQKTETSRKTPFTWLYKKLTHFGIRGLLIGS